MSDRASAVAALSELAQKPSTAHELRAEPGETFSAPAFERLGHFLQTLETRTQLNELIAEVAPLIGATDPFRASAFALQCGSLVESGGDPALVAPHLLGALPRHLELAQRAETTTFESEPDAHRARAGLTFLMLATMAVLCRDAAHRIAARSNPALVAGVEALREHHNETNFVAQVLGFTDGLEVLALVPAEGKGFRVKLEAVATCAHLFTLLQAELIGGGHLEGEPLDADVVRVARGEVPHTQHLYDSARFHFCAWFGMKANGELEGMNVMSWLPVEETPRAIPEFEGVPVVLIGPKVFASRSWDSHFFASIHDALRSRAEIVEVLTPDAARAWIEKIRAARA
jgi:hypothetical protein